MAGIFYDPQLHNWGGALSSGIMQGINTGLSAYRATQDIEEGGLRNKLLKMKTEEMEKEQKATDEIGKLANDYQTKIDELVKPFRGVEKPGERPTSPIMGAPANMTSLQKAALGDYQTQLAGHEQNVAAFADDEKIRDQVIDMGAERDRKIGEIYTKYGLTAKALEHDDKAFKRAGEIATAIGKEAALSYLKRVKPGMFDNAVVSDDKDHFQMTNIGPNKDGIARMDKRNGVIDVVKEPTAKEKKAPTTRSVKQGMNIVEQEWDEDTESWKVIGGGPRSIKGGSGEEGEEGEGKKPKVGELTAVQKHLAQKYVPLAQENAALKGMDAEETSKITVSNFYAYLSDKQRASYDRISIDAEKYARKQSPATAVNKALVDWHNNKKPGGAGKGEKGDTTAFGGNIRPLGKQKGETSKHPLTGKPAGRYRVNGKIVSWDGAKEI